MLGARALPQSPDEEPPLRSELFSADQMAQHGKALAASHLLAPGGAPDRLLARLAANETTLIDVCTLLTAAVASKRRISPAGGWLLDNFYLIEEQIRTAKRHLPKGYSRELPRLAGGPSAGLPRVYDIALAIISHGDGRMDAESLGSFVAAYQTVTTLQLGELWAIPIMLRLAVIENLRRVGVRIASGRAERNLADSWADQMMATAEQDPKSLILVIADMARSNPAMVSAFVAELARRLQGRGPALALPLTWIEQRLSESGQTIEQLVQLENQQQAADQVSTSNSIGSLRMLGGMDWREFVETMSVVEGILREDPSGVYVGMDFASRDRYRHATETLARRGRLSEWAVARLAVDLASAGRSQNALTPASDRAAHVGYYLIGKGLPELERAAAVRLPRSAALRRTIGRWPLVLYLGSIALFSTLLTAALWAATPTRHFPLWAMVLLGICTWLAASRLGVALVNWLTTLLLAPQPLPRMDFSTGIPPPSRTLVVVPTMLSRLADVDTLVEALEIRFLANRDDNLHFGLLTDFADADDATRPEDEALLTLAEARITALNVKYTESEGLRQGDLFFLFHRPRRWNPQERVWMGYERKRGKLAALNTLLRSGDKTAFSLLVGQIGALSRVKYVITLDTDTQLPRDAARQLVGTMAHPLNHPLYDAEARRVTEGYGILQPRMAIGLPGSNRSRYARLHGGESGIDPYTRTVSDVYQDAFGEGSFIGKGIYDVDAFEQALSGRFPENSILSHDLLEGCYARAGLLNDVELYEDYPAHYRTDVSRRYRWVRGDWQLAGWLLRQIPGPDTGKHRRRLVNPLSCLSQWKLLDNLRRSVTPAALTVLLLVGWANLSPAWLGTATVIGILLIPALCANLLALGRKSDEVLWRQHLAATFDSALRQGAQITFELACLPYEALYSLGAIARTIWRMQIAHRRLLEWRPSSEIDRETAKNDLLACCRSMWIGPVLAVASTVYLAVHVPTALAVAAPILLLWLVSPALAWWISLPLGRRQAVLSPEQTDFLRLLARKTWAFFDTFVGPDDHWLPPDNYQEYRVAAVAHRTSPTNIGLALLANLTAYDFGYITAGRLLERTALTLRTMAGLERHRGHFYNWYDTQTLQVLPPAYISTVDSGNLAGHLLTLRPGLLALVDEPILAARWFDGLGDTLAMLSNAAPGLALQQSAACRQLLATAISTPDLTLLVAQAHLRQLLGCAQALATDVASHFPIQAGATPESQAQGRVAHEAARLLIEQCSEMLAELDLLAPWLQLPVMAGLASHPRLAAIPTLSGLAQLADELQPFFTEQLEAATTAAQQENLIAQRAFLVSASHHAQLRIDAIQALTLQAAGFAQMDYRFLYDPARHLLCIGYNVTERRADTAYYDLLASEARLCSFVAIAQGQLPQESWFALGRLLASTAGEPVLLSWSGSMFEYLMPLLVMPTYEHTLLDQTCKAAVARQIEYGRQRSVPWGISESAYNKVDLNFDYQYRAFGVPGLGLKRGLAEDLVIAPYASALALLVAPEAACQNLQILAAEGFIGQYGLFEAIDYTPVRQRRGQSYAVVRAFMAHHQGMSLLALSYLLLARPMQRRFESDPAFQAVMLLLQERIPKATGLFSHTARRFDLGPTATTADMPIRVFTSPDTPSPEVQLLSNGRYHVMVSHAGGGYSRWRDLAVTRWREDATCDHWGSFCYIRELASGDYWSSGYQPTLKRPAHFEAIFSEGRAEFRRRDLVGDEDIFETYTEIVVSPEDDIELRRVRITNRSRQRREIDVTSYAEVVIAPPDADAQHPAFSKLFVQTEVLPKRRAILCTRRPRSVDEPTPWLLHLMVVYGVEPGTVSYETDRARFLGRTRTTAAPQAMLDTALSGTAGSVLDPVAAIRCVLVLEPDQSATIDIVNGMADTRELAVSMIEKYQDRHLADRVFDLAWTYSQVVLRQLNASEADSQLYARLASNVLYANARLRADATVLFRNHRGQSGLWSYAISGDLPIVLLQISDAANIDLVRQLVQAHAYWRLKGLAVDLVIWNEDHALYRQRLQDQIIGMIASGIEASVIDRPGGIFVRLAEQISNEDRILLQSVARAVITDGRGTLAEQLDHRSLAEPRMPLLMPSRGYRAESPANVSAPRRDLMLFNGLGGFTPDGREYVLTLAPGQTTPAPWVNVLANPLFGTVISESGSAYSWSENAHEFRLTPWQNDPVSDGCGEALYLRDEETGLVWSPTPLPAPAGQPYVVRHGFGYSVFETTQDGIRTELWVYVAMDAAIKFSVLKVRNVGDRPRRLSATAYVEWVLGDLAAKSAMHISTEIALQNGALYARNPYSTEFGQRVAFFDVDDSTRSVSGDRTEFLGRNGTLRKPAAMGRTRLSGKVGAGLDPCGAIRVGIDLSPGSEREIIFRLGVAQGSAEAGEIVQRFRGALAARKALEAVRNYWDHALGAVQVTTPDAAFNVLANGWLVYQTLACRLWARSGNYQSGGAFGFRDQLQDVMALTHTEPGLVRQHLLLCASRQFREGDVQHWWHPPAGRGVRTHCSDDYLWLPLAVCRYVDSSADTGVLDEWVPFLEGRPVNQGDDGYYDLPGQSDEHASLYEHCVRAIRHGLRFGEHGLPLIGSGDWNDGMNLVGLEGRGESVWLGFFLCEVLRHFQPLASARGDAIFAELCLHQAARLRQRLEQHGWDGEWYRRAYFDDGRALGSAGNTECRIDSISQSWSVLSGAGDATRSRQAMQAVYEHLVRPDEALIQLLDPPFDTSDLNPGYIRGYVPGVRENGGQYTHGAIWAAMAFAALDDRERAWTLLAMINPLSHARTAAEMAVYKVEPYVMAADVYAVAPHTGRGGWSWYTGSAGWMYRLMMESLLGLRLAGDKLHLTPCLPASWHGFKLRYRYRETCYHIVVSQLRPNQDRDAPTVCVVVDGIAQTEGVVCLQDDRMDHQVELTVYAK
ncbi:GH36-type glycosyl hydrolase domain-containing protein [Chitinimonas arctica]|uniref:GH36-type glycosyl hydrolase domain-containing protein n=1 Tax=Chitinimonas arctica TaxID=2594795 RepID=UPI0027E3C8B1|nr:glucoamylase family protein [Chitinimonas arctica]